MCILLKASKNTKEHNNAGILSFQRVLLSKSAKNMASSCLPSTKSSIMNILEDEKFEEIYPPNDDAIRLVDEKVKLGSFGCALGNHSYSFGIHCIRIKIHHGIVCLGIRSRNIVPAPEEYAWGIYDSSPSTYG
jgi:hypothetical protein